MNGVGLYSIAYGNGNYVAVGNWGTILTSPTNGVTWHNKSLPISTPLNRVAFGNGVFVACGADESVAAAGQSTTYFLVSADGNKWEIGYSELNPSIYGRSDYIYDLAFIGGKFVAVGGNKSFVSAEKTTWIMTSPDGSNWTTAVSEAGFALYAVTHAQDRFVAVGDNGTSMVSSNGVTWEIGNAVPFWAPSQWIDVMHWGGRFLALANTGLLNSPTYVLGSTNGLQWELEGEVTGWGGMNAFAPCGSQLLTSGEDGKTFVSTDAKTWSPVSLPTDNVVHEIETLEGRTFLVGAYGAMLVTSNGTIWNHLQNGIGSFIPMAMAFDGNVFVALGTAGIAACSADGKQWIPTALPSPQINAVVHANGKFVAVGYDHTILVSSNGQSWQTVRSNVYPYNVLTDVAWTGNLFVAVGWDGGIATSTNGLNWVGHQPTNNWFWSVTAGAGLFVANQGQIIVTTTNGVDWTTRTNTGGPIMRDGAYGNGRFVLVGDIGQAWVSTNGLDWISSVVLDDWLVTRVIFTGTSFIAAGTGGLIFSSPDGVQWIPHLLPAPNRVFGLAYGRNTVIVGGDKGMLLQSDPLSAPTATIRNIEKIGGNRIRLSLLAQPGTIFNLRKSATVGNWATGILLEAPLGRTVYEEESTDPAAFFQAIPNLVPVP